MFLRAPSQFERDSQKMNMQAGAGVANANMPAVTAAAAAAMGRRYPVAPGAPAAARAYPQAAEPELKQIPTEQVQVRQVETTPFLRRFLYEGVFSRFLYV